MNMTREVIIEAADKSQITFTIDDVVTQWHSEEMADIYTPYRDFYDKETKKMNLSREQSIALSKSREIRMIELYVKSWTRSEPVTAENVKKALLPTGFEKLMATINEIVDANILSAEKKTPSLDSSSSDSTPTETLTV